MLIKFKMKKMFFKLKSEKIIKNMNSAEIKNLNVAETYPDLFVVQNVVLVL